MSKRRIISLCMSVLLILLCFSACAGDTPVTSSVPSVSSATQSEEFTEEPNKYEHLRGTTIYYYTWIDPHLSYDPPTVEQFEEKFGINVEIIRVGQGDYIKSVSADMAAGKPIDVLWLEHDFVEALSVIQPLDAAKLDLNDPMWNRSIMEASTIDGKAYLADTLYNNYSKLGLCLYNKRLFDEAGLPYPDEYLAKGKWDMENFRYCAETISRLDGVNNGASASTLIVSACFGASCFSLENGRYKLTVDENYYNMMNFFSQMTQSGALRLDRSDFYNGNVGLAIVTTGDLARRFVYKKNIEEVGIVSMPRTKQGEKMGMGAFFCGAALAKHSQNPEGVGCFMRHALGSNDFINSTPKYIPDEFSESYKKIFDDYADNLFYVSHEVDLIKATNLGVRFSDLWCCYPPDEIRGYIESQLPTMETIRDMANKMIEDSIS